MSRAAIDGLGRKLMSDYVAVLRKHSSALFEGERFRGATWYEDKYAALRSLDLAQREAVSRLLDDLVVSSCHAMLELFDKDGLLDSKVEGRLALKVVDSRGIEVDASIASDGLAGELYGENGWLERFG